MKICHIIFDKSVCAISAFPCRQRWTMAEDSLPGGVLRVPGQRRRLHDACQFVRSHRGHDCGERHQHRGSRRCPCKPFICILNHLRYGERLIPTLPRTKRAQNQFVASNFAMSYFLFCTRTLLNYKPHQLNTIASRLRACSTYSLKYNIGSPRP